MKVIIAGMQRSGSTYTFNVVREFLQKNGTVSTLTCNSFDNNTIDSDHLIIKSHEPDESLTKRIVDKEFLCICSVRKPEDAIGSWKNTFGFNLNESITTLKSWIIWFNTVKDNVFVIRFEEIDRYPLLAVLRISKILFGKYYIANSIRIWFLYRKSRMIKVSKSITRNEETEDIGFSIYDKNTFLHKGHVKRKKSLRGKDIFSNAELTEIRSSLDGLVGNNGDLIQ